MKPTIAITMGDAAGISPEIIAKLLAMTRPWTDFRPLVIGDPTVMREASAIVGSNLRFRTATNGGEAAGEDGVDLVCPEGAEIGSPQRGKVDARMGRAAALCLEHAFRLAASGEVDGVVSGPLNKESFHSAGYDYFDELEFVAEITHAADPFILRVMEPVWSVSVTEHIPFREIADRIKKDRVLSCIRKLASVLERIGRKGAPIAVAALNVHGGEGGLFGREEIDEIAPAVVAARARGIDVAGPIPADTVFVRAFAGEFAGVVSMYHDQANIPRKLQPKRAGATVFLGLPVACATTAHGTAFDKAGTGSADPGSLQTALDYVVRLSSSRE